MSVGLQIKSGCTIISGGYPGEWHGIVDHTYDNWTTVPDSGSISNSYYYTDSDHADNNDSSQVYVTLIDSWSVTSRNPDNSIVVQVTSTIGGIVRTNLRGVRPVTFRDLTVRQSLGSPIIWSAYNDGAGWEHTISTGFAVGTHTFVIPAQSEDGRGTVHFKNHASGYPELPQYIDEFWMGIQLKNTLPDRYHPGAISVNGSWYSHNRAGGNTKIRSGNSWQEMWTINGGVASNDPPLIKHPSGNKNMREIGIE